MNTVLKHVFLVLILFFIFVYYYFIGNGKSDYLLHEELTTNVPHKTDSEISVQRQNTTTHVEKAVFEDKTRSLMKFSKFITPNKVYNGTVPNVIVQYGIPRTATTLQFHTLCVMMIMFHEDDVQKVGCNFNQTPTTKFKVIKCHRLVSILETVPANSWLFMTSGGNHLRQEKEIISSLATIKLKHIIIPFVVDISVILKKGYQIVNEYNRFFGVTSGQMDHISEYFRIWDILRICCGKQMSHHWRAVLHQRGKQGRTERKPTVELDHFCDKYNITEVENQIMNTYIYKKFAQLPSLSIVIGKPAIADDRLDGTYCERCNRNIAARKLKPGARCGY